MIHLRCQYAGRAVLVAALGLSVAVSVDGAPGGLRFRVQLLHQANNEGCDIGDINKDGKLDIVAGDFWYAGPDFRPQRRLRTLEPFGKDYLQNNGDHLYDVNGDGWVDVVSGGFTITQVYWHENPGAEGLLQDRPWTRHVLEDTKTEQNEITYLHDLDGDGKPEYLENSWNDANPMLAWRFGEREDGSPGLARFVIGPNANGHGMGFGDINGDGREDILFKRGWYECPSGGAFNGRWKLHEDFELPHGSCPVLVTDLDGDGRNDIIWADGHNYGLYWEEQQEPSAAGETRWRQHLIDKSFSQAHALAWVDIDNDGAPELITGKRYYAHSGSDPGAEDPVVVYYYDWDRATRTFTRQVISQGQRGRGPGIGLQIRVADLNGDGWKDIVTPGKTGTHVLWNLGRAGD